MRVETTTAAAADVSMRTGATASVSVSAAKPAVAQSSTRETETIVA